MSLNMTHLRLAVCSVVKVQHLAQYGVYGSASFMSGDSQHTYRSCRSVAPKTASKVLTDAVSHWRCFPDIPR